MMNMVKVRFLKYIYLILGILISKTIMSQDLGAKLSFSLKIEEPYAPCSGKFLVKSIPESPDPLVGYRWEKPSADDELESYVLHPLSVSIEYTDGSWSKPESLFPIKINSPCDLMFDFGTESAGWLEFDSDDFDGKVEMSISEYNEPAVLNAGAQQPRKTLAPVKYGSTYRLELNKELYEGVRFGWIHIKKLNKPCTINDVRLVCQVKPTNYLGSFSCSDPLLTRIWYTGAYTVKLNFQKDFFGAILMERSDRHSWTGDAYPAQAASLVAFGNYDFIRENLFYTSSQSNSIASYPIYWVLSLIDYCNYTGDKETLNKLLDNACKKLDSAYVHFDCDLDLGFNGWDERLGAGFENPNCLESQYVFRTLSIQAWQEFSELMKWYGKGNLSKKYAQYVEEKVNELRGKENWPNILGIHASSNIINAGVLKPEEGSAIWKNNYTDRLQRLSYSPFNQFFIIQAMAKMGKDAEALTTIDDCWGGQLRYGGTSFFEVYRPSWNQELGTNGAPINNQCGYTSLCHPWSAGVTKWLSEEVLGVTPAIPGFKSFNIKPHLNGKLNWVKGTVPTPHGTIEVSCNTKVGEMKLFIPPNTSANVAIPKNSHNYSILYINENMMEPKNADKDFIYLGKLEPGHYSIRFNPVEKDSIAQAGPLKYEYNLALEDNGTQGNWKSKYGQKGYMLFNYNGVNEHLKKLPGFIKSIDLRLNGNLHLENVKDDKRALVPVQNSKNKRNFGEIITRDPIPCLQTMTIDIVCRKRQPYQVSLYMVDFEKEGRRSAIEVFDLNNKALLMPVKLIREYQNGKYIVFNADRSIRIRVNQVRGSNASLSALFID